MQKEKQRKYEIGLRSLLTELEAAAVGAKDARSPVEVNGAMGRVSRGDAMQVQQMAVEMERRRQQRILQVGSALDRIRNGTYGLCGRCRGPISEERLEAMPEVVLCVRCADRAGSR